MHAPGDNLARYRLIAKIEAGVAGVVWEAHDTEADRRVDLRILPKLDAVQRRNVEEQIETLLRLSHPGIVAPELIGQDGDTTFLVAEHVEGETLAELIQAGPLEFSRWQAIAGPATAAIGAAHAHGLLHLHLRPGSFRLGNNGTPRVLDFGLTPLLDPSWGPDTDADEVATLTLTLQGGANAVPYVSPEQIEAKPLDPRADLFSMGAILYELLTGVHPFAGESPADVIVGILHDTPRPPSEIVPSLPGGVDALLAKSLAKDRAERFQTTGELVDALEQLGP